MSSSKQDNRSNNAALESVKPADFRTHDLVITLRRRADVYDRAVRRRSVEWMYHNNIIRPMSNKVKAAIAIVLGAIVQLLRLFGLADVPDFIVDSLTAVLAFIAGLFLPEPKSK